MHFASSLGISTARQQDEEILMLEMFTTTIQLRTTMMLMTFARSNKLIGKNASELECQVLDLKHQTASCSVKHGSQKWAGDKTRYLLCIITMVHILVVLYIAIVITP